MTEQEIEEFIDKYIKICKEYNMIITWGLSFDGGTHHQIEEVDHYLGDDWDELKEQLLINGAL